MPSAKLLYEDIITLLKNTDAQTRAQLGAYGRQTIMERYSVSRMTQDYIDAYDRLLMEKKLLNDVVISGYYGFKNNGDDALLSAIIEDLREQIPDVKICVTFLPSVGNIRRVWRRGGKPPKPAANIAGDEGGEAARQRRRLFDTGRYKHPVANLLFICHANGEKARTAFHAVRKRHRPAHT